MQNKVGDDVPSAKALAQLLGQLKEVVGKLREFGVTLSEAEHAKVLHERLGAQPHIEHVVELARKNGVALKSIPLDGLAADRTLFNAMNPFIAELKAGLTLVEHTAAQAESESWEAFLAYYGVLSQMADRDPELARELAPVVAFMANGPRKPKAPPQHPA